MISNAIQVSGCQSEQSAILREAGSFNQATKDRGASSTLMQYEEDLHNQCRRINSPFAFACAPSC